MFTWLAVDLEDNYRLARTGCTYWAPQLKLGSEPGTCAASETAWSVWRLVIQKRDDITTNENAVVPVTVGHRRLGQRRGEEAKQQSRYLKTLLVNTRHNKVSQPSICFFHTKFHFTYALFEEMCFTLSKQSNTIFSALCKRNTWILRLYIHFFKKRIEQV